MAHIIIHYNGVYNIYSSVTEEPLYEEGITEEQLRLFIKLKDGETGLATLPKRIDRAKAFGSSSFVDRSLHSVVDRNRAGVSGIRMTFNAFVDKYLTLTRYVGAEPGKSCTGQPIVDATRELVLCATCKSESHPDTKANGTVYTDRLLQWDFAKHDRLCEKHFGDTGQYWDRRDPNLIANFLRDWYDNPEIVLCEVIEYCNVSTGYPTWRLDFWVPG